MRAHRPNWRFYVSFRFYCATVQCPKMRGAQRNKIYTSTHSHKYIGSLSHTQASYFNGPLLWHSFFHFISNFIGYLIGNEIQLAYAWQIVIESQCQMTRTTKNKHTFHATVCLCGKSCSFFFKYNIHRHGINAFVKTTTKKGKAIILYITWHFFLVGKLENNDREKKPNEAH